MDILKTSVLYEDYANRMADILQKMGFSSDVQILNKDGQFVLVAHCVEDMTSKAIMQIRESHHNLYPEIEITNE